MCSNVGLEELEYGAELAITDQRYEDAALLGKVVAPPAVMIE